MKRELLFASAAGLIAAGCGADMAEQPMDAPTLAIERAIDNQQLPSSVIGAEQSALKLQFDVNSEHVVGSAGIVDVDGKRVVLSAAHVTSWGGVRCQDRHVLLPSLRKPTRVLDHSSPAPVGLSREYDPNYNHGIDATVSLIKGPMPEDLPALQTQEEVNVKKGDIVYNINYQPAPDNQARVPGVDQPSVTLGIVVAREGAKFDMVTGLHSYDTSGDSRTSEGSSGGINLNADGKYNGDTIASWEQSFSSDEIWKTYGLQLPDKPEGYPVAKVQIVTREMAHSLLRQAMHVEPCIAPQP
jgi:hypothetical protein